MTPEAEIGECSQGNQEMPEEDGRGKKEFSLS